MMKSVIVNGFVPRNEENGRMLHVYRDTGVMADPITATGLITLFVSVVD